MPEPPTAVVIATDNLAIGVLHAAHRMRVATVHNPVAEMAGLAVGLAINRRAPGA